MDDKIKNKSLAKAFSILECFLDKQQLGITELSKILGISKSSIHDTVSTLETLGYINKDSSTGKYYLGISCVRIGRAAMSNFAFKDIASIHIRELSELVEETCYLTIPYGFSVYFLDVAVPSINPVFSPALPNTTDAMSCTAGGKCMLAASSDQFIQEYINHGLPKMTENSITEPEKFWEEIYSIRKRGYAIDNMEYSIGIRCVAQSIISLDGSLLGAISISGPSPRMTDAKITNCLELLRQHVFDLVHSI